MDSIIKRIKYYGIGFGLGLIFVFFFFQNRGCSWTPSNRVKNAILDRALVVSEADMKYFAGKGLKESDLIQVLNDGDVDFKNSKKEGNPKIYLISKNGKSYRFTLPEESFISEIKPGHLKNVKTNSKEGLAKLVYIPNDPDLVYVDSSKVLSCQLEHLGLLNQRLILRDLRDHGQIDFSLSALSARPKAEHYLYFVHKGKTVGAKAVWYKNKIMITSFHFENDPCHD